MRKLVDFNLLKKFCFTSLGIFFILTLPDWFDYIHLRYLDFVELIITDQQPVDADSEYTSSNRVLYEAHLLRPRRPVSSPFDYIYSIYLDCIGWIRQYRFRAYRYYSSSNGVLRELHFLRNWRRSIPSPHIIHSRYSRFNYMLGYLNSLRNQRVLGNPPLESRRSFNEFNGTVNYFKYLTKF